MREKVVLAKDGVPLEPIAYFFTCFHKENQYLNYILEDCNGTNKVS